MWKVTQNVTENVGAGQYREAGAKADVRWIVREKGTFVKGQGWTIVEMYFLYLDFSRKRAYLVVTNTKTFMERWKAALKVSGWNKVGLSVPDNEFVTAGAQGL